MQICPKLTRNETNIAKKMGFVGKNAWKKAPLFFPCMFTAVIIKGF